MSNIAFSLDWLKVTFAHGRKIEEYEPPINESKEYKEVRARGSYSDGKSNGIFSIYWHDEHPEFRVLVEITGEGLSDYRQEGNDTIDIVRWAIENEGRFTRLDFAVDLFDTGGSPLDILCCWETDQLMTVGRSVMIVERKAKQKSYGATVYIGSRSSERCIRVYDKGKERKTNLDWIRVEMEIKGGRAVQFGEVINREGLVSGGLSYMADYVEWSDIEWFNSMWGVDYTQFDIDSIGRPETNRERWLFNVCIPALVEAANEGLPGIEETLKAIILQIEDRSKHGPRITIGTKK